MTPAEALQRAARILDHPDNLRAEFNAHATARAAAWIGIAAELRAQADATARPVAVQDVEVRHCHHGTIVVRLPGGASEAWWHPGSKGWCDDTEPTEIPAQPAVSPRVSARLQTGGTITLPTGPAPGETRREIVQAVRATARPSTLGELPPAAEPGGRTTRLAEHGTNEANAGIRHCENCGTAVEAPAGSWRHVRTRSAWCVPDETDLETGSTAWPRGLGKILDDPRP